MVCDQFHGARLRTYGLDSLNRIRTVHSVRLGSRDLLHHFRQFLRLGRGRTRQVPDQCRTATIHGRQTTAIRRIGQMPYGTARAQILAARPSGGYFPKADRAVGCSVVALPIADGYPPDTPEPCLTPRDGVSRRHRRERLHHAAVSPPKLVVGESLRAGRRLTRTAGKLPRLSPTRSLGSAFRSSRRPHLRDSRGWLNPHDCLAGDGLFWSPLDRIPTRFRRSRHPRCSPRRLLGLACSDRATRTLVLRPFEVSDSKRRRNC